jgi:hypothetical protein
MKSKSWVEIVGWLGVVFIILAYTLNIMSVIHTDSAIYHLLNILGAIGIITDGLKKKDLQPVVLNLIWLAVALIAVLR